MEINWDYVLVALALLMPFGLYGGWVWIARVRRKGQLKSLAAGKAEPSFASAAGGQGEDPEQEDTGAAGFEFAAAGPEADARAGEDPAPMAPAPEAGQGRVDESAAAAAEAGDDEFPALAVNDLPEKFYYVARLSCKPPGFAAAQMREMSADIIRQAHLQKHQLLLGWDGGKWQTLRSEMKYRFVVWCMPLCTRAVRIENDEIAAVTRCIRNWMQRTGGLAQLPPVSDVEANLQEVDEFCEHVDQIVSARLIAVAEDNAKVRTCSQILEIAYAHGLESVEGRIERRLNSETLYVMRSANGDDLGRKSPDRKLASIVLELDVPRVTRPRESCEEMFEFAGKLARVLGYRMVDEEGEQLERQHEQQCLQMIEDIGQALREEGIKPGSRLARALF